MKRKGETMYADENVIKIKHEVLYEVARLAFAGNLNEKREDIQYDLIKGPTPKFRCCIYKEREIIRQRVSLAEGNTLYGNDENNIIQVIHSACEDCPISAARTVWARHVSMPASSARSSRDAIAPTSIRRSVRSAASVHRHARTMQSHIWYVHVRTAAR